MPFRWFRTLRERRDRVNRDATDLSRWMGEDAAYAEARARARECRAKQDGAREKHWSRVAVEIARRTGYVISEKVGDRYAAEADNLWPPGYLTRDAGGVLADIANAIADLAHGRGNATTVQNVSAWVHQAIVASGSSTAVVKAGEEVVRACEALAHSAAECRDALAAGDYPAAADHAGHKLQAFAAALRHRR